jgi:hypothetical protein
MSPIREVETIASGVGVENRRYLRLRYGGRHWRKMKGVLACDYTLVKSLKRKFIDMKLTESARRTSKSNGYSNKRTIRGSTPLVVCLDNSESDLTRGVVYELMTDKKAATHGYVRVVDDSGEDYLYPASMFLRLRFRKPPGV